MGSTPLCWYVLFFAVFSLDGMLLLIRGRREYAAISKHSTLSITAIRQGQCFSNKQVLE